MSRIKNVLGFTGALVMLIFLTMIMSVNAYADTTAATAEAAAATETGAESDDSTELSSQDFGPLLIFGDDEKSIYEIEAEKLAAEKAAAQEAAREASSGLVSLGTFRLTAYCPCYSCSEGWGSQTSTGRRAQAGRTIAVDPRIIPYGSRVVINGHEYIAEDCGGAIKQKRIDVYFNSHAQATKFGVQYAEVFLVK